MPIGQQEIRMNILQRWYVDQRRAEIALAAQASLADFREGKLQLQPLDTIVQELRQSLHDNTEIMQTKP
jgi:hypothetical protein